MFSQWATKRVCKFFMKRLLGRVLRSELDLEQLDVQLGSGRIQLRDLALNTEYINDQLGDSSVILKEGSVGSVSAKIPWKLLSAEPCEIDVDELELVFVPRPVVENRNESCPVSTSSDVKDADIHQFAVGDGDPGGTAGGTYLGVDDGVRMIAKMVERVLLGLRVRVTNLIGVFEDESPSRDNMHKGQDVNQDTVSGILVVRVAYAEYGVESPMEQQDSNVFGIAAGAESSMLVKVISFRGATLEVLDLARTRPDGELCLEGVVAAGGLVEGQSIPIVSGQSGGVAGKIQLSMPWKDGILDVPKVNAHIAIGQVKVKASTKEIQQVLLLGQAYSRPDTVRGGQMSTAPRASSQYSVSFYEPAGFGRGSSVMSSDRNRDLSKSAFKPSTSMGVIPDVDPSQTAFLPVTKFISDWMPWGGGDSPKRDTSVAEADLAASVDEFFECFDGTWSSHASSSASGLWNWTRSAFTVITAASSLASGSMVLSPGFGREVEYSATVKLTGLSLAVVSETIRDDEPSGSPNAASKTPISDSMGIKDQTLALNEAFVNKAAEGCLEIDFTECVLSVAVSERQTNLRITVESVEISELVNAAYVTTDGYGCNVKSLEDVLPPFPVSLSEDVKVSACCSSMAEGSESFWKNTLLKVNSADTSAARVAVSLQHAAPVVTAGLGGGNVSRDFCSTIELKAYLQPIIMFLDAYALKRTSELINSSTMQRGSGQGQEKSHVATCGKGAPQVPAVDQMLADLDKRHKGTFDPPAAAATSGKSSWGGRFEASLFAPCLRIIIGFPECSQNRLRDDIIVLDMAMPFGKVGVAEPLLTFKHEGTMKDTSSSHVVGTIAFRFGDGVAYLIGSGKNNLSGSKQTCHSSGFILRMDQVARFSSSSCEWEPERSNRFAGEQASLEYKWFDQPKAGAWLAKRAWDAAWSQQRRADGMGGSNSEFASATAADCGEEDNVQLRKEIVSCSSAVMHLRLPRVWINSSSCQYMLMCELFSSLMDIMASEGTPAYPNVGTARLNKYSPVLNGSSGVGPLQIASQTSVLVECAHVDLILHPSCDEAPNWNVLTGEVENLQVLSVSQMGGRADVSYFWMQHEECQITGSYPDAQSITLTGDSDLLLFSCRSDNLGRGDGGEGNALNVGAAGISVTYMFWPGRDKLADLLLTGSMRGATFVAHSGRLDWIGALVSFFVETSGSSLPEQTADNTSVGEGITPKSEDRANGNRLIRLFDLHDVALCYEPGKEVMLVPGSKVSISSGNDDAGGLTCSPVACVLAAAAVRVSSSPGGDACGDPYDIWFRDSALHVVNTNMRMQPQERYSLESMHCTGYRQIAKAAVLGVSLRVGCDEGLSWEVDCVDNQLRMETCSDTASALAQLVAQLQQLFAPDWQGGNVHWGHSEGTSGEEAGVDIIQELEHELGSAGKSFSMSDSQEIKVLEFFKAVLESPGAQHGDFHTRDVDENNEGSSSYVHSDSGASFEARHDMYSSVDSEKNHSSLSQSQQKEMLCQDKIEDVHSPRRQVLRRPVFIEDYYLGAETSPSSGAVWQELLVGHETEGKAGWYNDSSFSLLENHIPKVIAEHNELPKQSKRHERSHGWKSASPMKYPQSIGRVVLRNFSARWKLYGGSDWTAGKVQDKSISKFSKSGRQVGLCLEVIVNDVDLQYDSFPEVGEYASRLVVAVKDMGVCDCSTDAPWRMVLGYHRSATRPRESSSRAVKIEMDAVRPDPSHFLEEYRLSLMLLPIRLHLDQRHIDFFIEFFSAQKEGEPANVVSSARSGSTGSDVLEETLLPFFQTCDVKPFTIRVDYLPRRVDLSAIRGGNYAELLNLVSWKGIELHLKHVRAGRVHGWSSLSGVIFGEWLEDISQNQVHKFVKGVGPIRPLYAVGAGAAKLLVFPAEHYRKDRRVLRGMRKGAIAFLRSVSLEALGLGAQLAAGAHDLLYHTELALGGTRATVSCASDRGDMSGKSCQPGDTREGIIQACESISRGLERTASSLVGNPVKVYQRGAGAGVAVACALRAAPAAAVAPAAAAVGAVRCALLGVRNGLDPEHKRESDEKHAGPPYMYQ